MPLKRHIVFALLSLLLVLSQQLGMAHAITHWADYRQGAGQLQAAQQGLPGQQAESDAEAGRSAGLALEHHCCQCAAFAQLASAIPAPDFAFPFTASRAPCGLPADDGAPRAPSARFYDTRAPPLA